MSINSKKHEINTDRDEVGIVRMVISDLELAKARDGYWPVKLFTNRGTVEYRYYFAVGSTSSVILSGDVAGPDGDDKENGWHTPGKGKLYPRLGTELAKRGISALWVKYRHPTDLVESVLDVLGGALFLKSQDISLGGIVGHSFGGAVAFQSAVALDDKMAVVSLSSQSYGAEAAAGLKHGSSVLFIHGFDDEILPITSSLRIHALARGHKELIFCDRTNHNLDQAADEVFVTVHQWLVRELKPAVAGKE